MDAPLQETSLLPLFVYHFSVRVSKWLAFKQLKSHPLMLPFKEASLEQFGHQMAATVTPRLDMRQSPQQTAEVNLCH